ncbi:hypothetical protein [Paraburkholderia strydomiana]|uniref:hypothetical protein n=1 Tax=Paraburkholderia strydomiana TaxID=1245417 RepID=UPI0038BB91A2
MTRAQPETFDFIIVRTGSAGLIAIQPCFKEVESYSTASHAKTGTQADFTRHSPSADHGWPPSSPLCVRHDAAKIDAEGDVHLGFLEKSGTLEALARKYGIDPAGLKRAVERHNAFSRSGVHADFGRGQTVYAHSFGDTSVQPSSTLGPIDTGRFLTCKAYPGDLGTTTGLLTDEYARVLAVGGKSSTVSTPPADPCAGVCR